MLTEAQIIEKIGPPPEEKNYDFLIKTEVTRLNRYADEVLRGQRSEGVAYSLLSAKSGGYNIEDEYIFWGATIGFLRERGLWDQYCAQELEPAENKINRSQGDTMVQVTSEEGLRVRVYEHATHKSRLGGLALHIGRLPKTTESRRRRRK